MENINWIEINLPQDLNSSDVEITDDKYLNSPCFDKQEKEIYGITLDELNKDIQKLEDVINEVSYDILSKFGEIEQLTLDEFEPRLVMLCDEYKLDEECKQNLNKLKEPYDLRNNIREGEEERPEFKEWKLYCDNLEEELCNKTKELSFCGKGLNKPGTLVEFSTGEIFLIGGTLNPKENYIQCLYKSRSRDNDEIVTRYAVLI